MAERSRKIIAYRLSSDPEPLDRLSIRREWMDATDRGHAYRCLPMVMANQCGWTIRTPVDFLVVWNGGSDTADIKIYDIEALLGSKSRGPFRWMLARLLGRDGSRVAGLGPFSQALFALLMKARRMRRSRKLRRSELKSSFVESHFGSGVLTFRPSYLFRTSEGANLWAKGPANHPKDGIVPLEGIVESDWLPYTFTMNWKLTRPWRPILFRKGEPILNIVPYPRHYVEDFRADTKHISEDATLERKYTAWRTARSDLMREMRKGRIVPGPTTWQKHYQFGRDLDGDVFHDHQTKLDVDPFPNPAAAAPPRTADDAT